MPTIEIHWIGLKHHKGFIFVGLPIVQSWYWQLVAFNVSSEAQCGTPVYLWVTATMVVSSSGNDGQTWNALLPSGGH